MSDYHILQQDKKRKSVNVVFHIPVSEVGTNEAGLSWRDAVVNSLGGSGNIKSILADITTQEDTDLKAGVVLELQTTVRFSSINLTIPQRKAEIEAKFNEEQIELINEKQITLEWIGFSNDVP